MKKTLKKVFASLLAVAMMFASFAIPAKAEGEEFLMFLAFGGDSADASWGYEYYGEGAEKTNPEIQGTTAMAKVGDTVTIGLTMPGEVAYTWFMAPVLVAEGVSNVDYTVDKVTIDGADITDTIDFSLGDKEWWYEATGSYTDTQSIRLKGGYNEWSDKFIAESPTGFTTIEYTITLNDVTFGEVVAGEVSLSEEEYQAFIAIGGNNSTGEWTVNYAGEESVDGIVATNGVLKNGETTVLSLEFAEPVTYTWYVAPCMIMENNALLDASSTFDVKVFLDDVEVTPDFSAGDAYTLEATGAFDAAQCVRLAGGYNEWGTKYLAESPAGYSKITFEITPTIYVKPAPVEEEAPQNEFDPNGTYHAYFGVQTPTWIFRNSFDDATYGLESGCFDQLGFTDGEWIAQGGTFTDVEITGNGTYTVGVSGYDFSGTFQDKPILDASGLFNLLFVSTDLPVNDAVVISNVVLKMDGKEITTQAEAFVDKESIEVQKILLANIWNDEVPELPYYAAPTDSIEITFTVSGFANDAEVAAPESSEAPVESSSEAVSTETEAGSSNTMVIVIVVVVVVIAAVAAGVVVSKKKKAK